MARSRLVLWAAVALLVVAAGVGGHYWREQSKRIPVQTEPATVRDLVARVSASGEVKPRRFVDVGAQVSGRLEELFVDEGDAVRAGQTLARIDSTRFEAETRSAEAALAAQQAELERALAELEVARLDHARAEQMRDAELISQQAFDASQAQLRMASAGVEALRRRIAQQEAALASIRDNLEKTTVVSPMDGVVTRLSKEAGEMVIGAQSFSPTVIMTVADLGEMECEVMVDENDIEQVALGQAAQVEVDALRGVVIRGRVTEIGASALPRGGEAAAGAATAGTQAKEFRVTIALEAPPESLKPGLNATAEIETARRQGVVSVPLQAVVVRTVEGRLQATADDEGGPVPLPAEEKEGVFVVGEGRAEFRPVRTGILGDTDVEILDGLAEGEEVVVGSYRTLRTLEDDTPVEIEEEEDRDEGFWG